MPCTILHATPFQTSPCPCVTDPDQIAARHADMLGDESRLRAPSAAALFLPETPGQAADALRTCADRGWRAVLSGGRTGITGAAAPLHADAVISLAGLRRIREWGQDNAGTFVRLDPGVSLAALDAWLLHDTAVPGTTIQPGVDESAAGSTWKPGAYWFPVDPTERTAHFGGMVANNASGARSYRHGATRPWVRGLTLLLPTGGCLHLRRGECLAGTDGFEIRHLDGNRQRIALPRLPLPPTKCTAGYPLTPGMDAIDLCIGSEGTLGAIVEIELALAPRPARMLGVNIFPEGEAAALDLVEAVRACRSLPLEAVEYFDPDTLRLLKQKRDTEGKAGHVPPIRFWEGAAVYLELTGTTETLEAAADALETCLRQTGIDPERTWAADTPTELDAQKGFRHAVPESVNALIGQRKTACPGLHKVGTDMAVPDGSLREMMRIYRDGLAGGGLESVVFGHIGDNHLHVNILPRGMEDMHTAKSLYENWARETVRLGGAVSAEHGIGRIKTSMLAIQYPPDALEAMRAVRKAFDPEGMLAPGVLV